MHAGRLATLLREEKRAPVSLILATPQAARAAAQGTKGKDA